jgi:tetratricopeptide (TPR) repeat protein
MKRQAYNSSPLPISWNREDYIQGTRDVAHVIPVFDQPIDLKLALDFVRSNDPKYKKVSGYSQELDYIPSQTLVYKVDSAAVVNTATLSGKYQPYMLKEMTIDLNGKSMLGKQELIILDMLQKNNWERPIYYATTVSPDQFVRLDGYFQQTGMAYQIVPLAAKNSPYAVNSEKMYDNVMNKFKWGNVNLPGVYLDETIMRMCRSYRMSVFAPLARTLIGEGENERALKVLDKAMEVLPPENVPMDYSVIYIGECYFLLGAKEKAEAIYDEVARIAVNNLNWCFRLHSSQRESVMAYLEQNLAVLQETIRQGERYESEYVNKYKSIFDEFHIKYSAVSRN